MTSITHEQQTVPLAALERAVFVTDDDRRSRRLRKGAAAALLISALWIGGLAVGMLGVGELPSVSLPLPGQSQAPKPAVRNPADTPSRVTPAAEMSSASDRARGSLNAAPATQIASTAKTSVTQGRAKSRPSTSWGSTTRPARPVAPVASPVVQAPPTSAPTRRGVVRRGLTTPPGQSRSAERQATVSPPATQANAHEPKPTDAPIEDPSATTTPPSAPVNPNKPPPKA